MNRGMGNDHTVTSLTESDSGHVMHTGTDRGAFDINR